MPLALFSYTLPISSESSVYFVNTTVFTENLLYFEESWLSFLEHIFLFLLGEWAWKLF